MEKISIVIPVFRNEDTIKLTYESIIEQFRSHLIEYDYEFIFVNDGSDDNSMRELLALRKTDPKVTIIEFSRNFGQGPAITAGLHEATGDFVISISADMQDPVELIPEMVSGWKEGNQVIICNRGSREDFSFTSWLHYKMMRFSNITLPEGGFDYFGFGRNALNHFNSIDDRQRVLQADVLWVGHSVKFIPYKRKKRIKGKSQWNFRKRFHLFTTIFFNTSYLPIRFMSVLGVLTAFSGFMYAVFIMWEYFVHGNPVKGWAPIMIVLLCIGGCIMIMLGIIGEYIWRIYDEAKKRPYYLVKEKYFSRSEKILN